MSLATLVKDVTISSSISVVEVPRPLIYRMHVYATATKVEGIDGFGTPLSTSSLAWP